MIELPDDHCYLVIRISMEAKGQKKTHILGCFNQLSQANERAKVEAYEASLSSTIISQQKPSVVVPTQRTGLLGGLYFAFIESNGGGDAAELVEIRVKRIPVQRESPITKTSPKMSYFSPELSSMEFELQDERKDAMTSVVSRCLHLVPPAEILATRQRVESEIDKVPAEEYQSKYEKYLAREEDINILLSSSNSADTFLGQTLKNYAKRRLSSSTRLHAPSFPEAIAPSSDHGQPSNEKYQFTAFDIDALIAEASLSSESKEVFGSNIQAPKSPKSPVSPLSLDDAVSLSNVSEQADCTTESVAASRRMSIVLDTTFASPERRSRAGNTSAPSTPPRPTKVTKSYQKSPSPRVNRFLRLTATSFLVKRQSSHPKAPYYLTHGRTASPRSSQSSRSSISRSNGSMPSPTYTLSRPGSPFSRRSQEYTSPRYGVSRSSSRSSCLRKNSKSTTSSHSRSSSIDSEFRRIQTSANTQTNRGPGPAIRRRTRDSLDHSAYGAKCLSKKIAEARARAEERVFSTANVEIKKAERCIPNGPRAMLQHLPTKPRSQLAKYRTQGMRQNSTHHGVQVLRQRRVHFEDDDMEFATTNPLSASLGTPARVQDSSNRKSGWTIVNPTPLPIPKTTVPISSSRNERSPASPSRRPMLPERLRKNNTRRWATEKRRNARDEILREDKDKLPCLFPFPHYY